MESDTSIQSGATDFDVLIIGAGVSGLGMAITLKREGRERFVVLEKGDSVGGTWRDNRYPGCACDVPSHLYCYSFAPNPNWSRLFAGQAEIRAYLEDCATRFDVRSHIRFGRTVTEARYIEEDRRWRVTAETGEVLTARIIVSGQGALHIPKYPTIKGIGEFTGTQFHSAAWPEKASLKGKRVAVVGTGASAVQVVPNIVDDVASLVVFQRHAPWIEPKPDVRFSKLAQWCFRVIPGLGRLFRKMIYRYLERRLPALLRGKANSRNEQRALAHLAHQVDDADLRAKLTPTEAFGCKRILISNDYYPAFSRPNVQLEVEPIRRIVPGGLQTDEHTYEVDTIVWCTGFHVTDPRVNPLGIIGRDNRSLTEEMSQTAKAYLGVATEGYPNLFWLMGPHTGLGHNSMIYMIECQIQHIMSVLRLMRENEAEVIEVSKDAQDRFEAEMDAKMEGTVWRAGCTAWYQDPSGRISTLWPDHTYVYKERTQNVIPEDYVLIGGVDA